MRKALFLAVLLLALAGGGVLGGCVATSDGDLRLIHQNIGAAKAILARYEQEPALGLAIMGPARDILANSIQLQENLGAPKDQKPYSPEVSKADREKSKEEHATPWWQVGLVAAGSILLGLLKDRIPVLNLLTRFAPKLFGGVGEVASVALTDGIALARQEIRSRPDGQKSISEFDLLGILGEVQEKAGVKEIVADLAHKAEEKLSLHL